MLAITISNSVQDCRNSVSKAENYVYKDARPEGSFKCDRVARSSAVSNKGGLRSGGRPSLFSFISLLEVLIVISYAKMNTYA